MKLLWTALPLFFGLNSGATISDATLERIVADRDTSCSTNQHDCLALELAAGGTGSGDYFTASVTLVNVVEREESGLPSCCYAYELVHQIDVDTCHPTDPKNSALSHLDMDDFCDDASGVVVTGGGATCETADGGAVCNVDGENSLQRLVLPNRDGSTCYAGIKWDAGMDEVEDAPQASQNTYTYEVCLSWDGFIEGGGCNTGTSWIMVKAGQTFDFEEGLVPSCDQEPVTPDTCTDLGSGFESLPHECVCVDDVSECPEAGPYCKSLGFVADRLSEGGVIDPCIDGVCCCHCVGVCAMIGK